MGKSLTADKSNGPINDDKQRDIADIADKVFPVTTLQTHHTSHTDTIWELRLHLYFLQK